MTRHTSMTATRRALHGIAELVLAGPQYRRAGDIRLRVTPGGFGTVQPPDLRMDADVLVAADQRVAVAGHTYAEVAAAVGQEASSLKDVYSGGPGIGVDETIEIDTEAARYLARCFELGDAALRILDPATDPVLWPEHFDVGITLGEINYGVAPGDDHLAEPYAYVGPWQRRVGEFWNFPFGAARSMREFEDAAAVLAFFGEGRERAVRDPLAS